MWSQGAGHQQQTVIQGGPVLVPVCQWMPKGRRRKKLRCLKPRGAVPYSLDDRQPAPLQSHVGTEGGLLRIGPSDAMTDRHQRCQDLTDAIPTPQAAEDPCRGKVAR